MPIAPLPSSSPFPPPEPGGAASPLGSPAAIPENGWLAPGVPGGRVLPCDLSKIDEDQLLRGGRAALYPIGDGPGDFDPQAEPVVLVHGLNGDPVDLQAVADRLRGTGKQLYVLCYDDEGRRTSLNGLDLSTELRGLVRCIGRGRPLSIVAHSMGGIVSRQALNDLTAAGGIDAFDRVRLVAVDTPWHGFDGPSDRGIESFLMTMARPFMPDGLEDMRAASALFAGDPGNRNQALRQGLWNVDLPDRVTVDLAFARSGDQARDYTEGGLAELSGQLVTYMNGGRPVGGSLQMVNYWRALVGSTGYAPLMSELRGLKRAGALNEASARAALERVFPRFAGNHAAVLRDRSLLDFVCSRI